MAEIYSEVLTTINNKEKYDLVTEIDFLLQNIDGRSQIVCERSKFKKLFSVLKGDYNEAQQQIPIDTRDILRNISQIQKILIDDLMNVKKDLQQIENRFVDIENRQDLFLSLFPILFQDLAEINNKDYSPLIKLVNEEIKNRLEIIEFNELIASAENGDSNAQYKLGYCYYIGCFKNQRIEQNYKQAFNWWLKSAKQNNPISQNAIGTCYYYGEGTNINYTEAFGWFFKSANRNYAPAQYNVGLCYKHGKGIQRIIPYAYQWFRKAANQGHKEAENQVNELEEQWHKYFEHLRDVFDI